MATTTLQLLTLDEAAEYLTVLSARLRRWAKAGQVPCVVLPDGELRFAPSDLDVWIGELRQSASVGARSGHPEPAKSRRRTAKVPRSK